MKEAIVLSGQAAALGVARSLARMNVPVVLAHYGKGDFAQRSRVVKIALETPHPEKRERDFVDFLLGCADRFRGALLIPAADESLVAVSRHKEELGKHFVVACTDWEVTRRFIDKQFTYAIAERCGVPAPRTLVPHSVVEARQGAREIGFPCLVKPCQSHLFHDRFRRKMVRVESSTQLEETYRRVEEEGLEIMLQEIIPGHDREVVNYNAYLADGEFVAEFTAIHLRNAPPRFGSTRVAVSRHVPEVIEPGRRILRELEFSGYACTEFKRDPRDGVYKLMEVNGRHNLSTLLAVRCGINFPWLHYCHLSEGLIPHVAAPREGIYWIDLVRDLGATAIHLAREGHSLRDYLRPYLQPHVFADLDRRDVFPLLTRVASLAGRIRDACFVPGKRPRILLRQAQK